MSAKAKVKDQVVLERQNLQGLLDALRKRGYDLIGPTLRDSAIIFDEIAKTEDLPTGWTDDHDGGMYRLKKTEAPWLFRFNNGPHSCKKYLHPAQMLLSQVHRTGRHLDVTAPPVSPRPFAFIGIHACDLRAVAIMNTVCSSGPYPEPGYSARLNSSFFVALNCGKAGGTCFCASMGTGPKAQSGFDLALTEVLDGSRHFFVVEVGSEKGGDALADVATKPASQGELESATRMVAEAEGSMGRKMDTKGIKELLYANLEHPRWDHVAGRCLTCSNCTMVCPTCFCTTVEDTTNLTGTEAERWRRWDSCFTLDFSYVYGGSVRATPRARYRQWMTHKLATWYDQFNSSGCVGCGRCITWCPVGIDITEEARAIRESGAKG
jgi:sulfhydrogenase subunit beta (sulfur reductase)